MAYTYQYFPYQAIALQREIVNHPRLCSELSALNLNATLEERVAVIAKYCDVLVDGYMDEARLVYLFDLLLKKLKEKGTIIVHAIPPLKM